MSEVASTLAHAAVWIAVVGLTGLGILVAGMRVGYRKGHRQGYQDGKAMGIREGVQDRQDWDLHGDAHTD